MRTIAIVLLRHSPTRAGADVKIFTTTWWLEDRWPRTPEVNLHLHTAKGKSKRTMSGLGSGAQLLTFSMLLDTLGTEQDIAESRLR